MTETETRSILRTLQNAYPHRYRDMSKSDAEETVRQWSALDPFAAVKTAVDNWVSSQRFHPTIADIRAIMTQCIGEDPMRTAFKSMVRFRLRQMEQLEKPPEEIAAFKNRYAEFLEDTP